MREYIIRLGTVCSGRAPPLPSVSHLQRGELLLEVLVLEHALQIGHLDGPEGVVIVVLQAADRQAMPKSRHQHRRRDGSCRASRFNCRSFPPTPYLSVLRQELLLFEDLLHLRPEVEDLKHVPQVVVGPRGQVGLASGVLVAQLRKTVGEVREQVRGPSLEHVVHGVGHFAGVGRLLAQGRNPQGSAEPRQRWSPRPSVSGSAESSPASKPVLRTEAKRGGGHQSSRPLPACGFRSLGCCHGPGRARRNETP
eukprot:scaffold3100_cov248-Pinguiococcus_pyrenoidosus.AAC.13